MVHGKKCSFLTWHASLRASGFSCHSTRVWLFAYVCVFMCAYGPFVCGCVYSRSPFARQRLRVGEKAISTPLHVLVVIINIPTSTSTSVCLLLPKQLPGKRSTTSHKCPEPGSLRYVSLLQVGPGTTAQQKKQRKTRSTMME